MKNYLPIVHHWLLDMESTITLLCGSYASTLIEGGNININEIKFKPYLEAFFLSGGLEEDDEKNNENNIFLQEFIEGKGDALIFYQWLENQKVGKCVLSAFAKKTLETAERYIIAIMIKQLQIIGDVKNFLHFIKSNNDLVKNNSMSFIKNLLILIVQEASKIFIDLQKRGQIENLWRVTVKEKPNYETFLNFWKDEKKEKLQEICELKGIECSSGGEILKKLYGKLLEDFTKITYETEINSYEIVCTPIIERAKIILNMKPCITKIPLDLNIVSHKVEELRKWLLGLHHR